MKEIETETVRERQTERNRERYREADMDRRLLASIGGCALDCAKRKGFFCDPNTGNCEPCIDICHPSRGTLDECRDQIPCKDFWNMSASTALNVDTPMTSAAAAVAVAADPASSDLLLLTVTPILVVICVLLLAILAFVFIRRRKLRARAEGRRAERDVIYKPPIPVSTEEQDREHLAAAATANENLTYIDVPPEVDERRSPLISA